MYFQSTDKKQDLQTKDLLCGDHCTYHIFYTTWGIAQTNDSVFWSSEIEFFLKDENYITGWKLLNIWNDTKRDG